MKTRVTPREIDGLSEVSARFPAVLCDVWGVVHDGVLPLQSGVDALVAYRNNGGVVMLISNAPRPSWSVREQMVEIGVNVSCFDGLITSGDVTRSYLQEQKGARVFHLGPDRDYSIYEGLSVETSGLDSADVVCCSGLFDETTEQPEQYDPMLAQMKELDLLMVCANPDIVVESGDRLIPCAGALAARYEAIGGSAMIVGKPNAPIYDRALAEIRSLLADQAAAGRVLAIGDGAKTDIVGANRAGLDTLFIASGIHAAEYGDDGRTKAADVAAFMDRNKAVADYFMSRLSW